jgi:hypothetical protein
MTRMLRKALEHAPRCVAILCASRHQEVLRRLIPLLLDGWQRPAASLCQRQDGATTVARVVGANQ